MCKNSSYHDHYQLTNAVIDESARVSRNLTNKKRELPKIALFFLLQKIALFDQNKKH